MLLPQRFEINLCYMFTGREKDGALRFGFQIGCFNYHTGVSEKLLNNPKENIGLAKPVKKTETLVFVYAGGSGEH